MTYRVGQDQKRCAIGAGFAEAGPLRMVILTDEYVEREGVDEPACVAESLSRSYGAPA